MNFQKVRMRKNNSMSHNLDKWFIIRKINILLWVCKTEKVYIIHARHTSPFVVYIFWKQDFLIFHSLNIFVFK